MGLLLPRRDSREGVPWDLRVGEGSGRCTVGREGATDRGVGGPRGGTRGVVGRRDGREGEPRSGCGDGTGRGTGDIWTEPKGEEVVPVSVPTLVRRTESEETREGPETGKWVFV